MWRVALVLTVAGCAADPCSDRAIEEHLNHSVSDITSLSYGAALTELDAVLACRADDDSVMRRAYQAACGSGQRPRIRTLFARLVAMGADAQTLKGICFDFGIDPTR